MGSQSTSALVSRTSVLGGFVGGLVHTGVALFLWDRFGFDSLPELLLIKPVDGVYILLGMFVLGFVPAALYIGQRSVSPAIVVSGSLLLSGFGSWQAGPVRAPVGGPTPYGLYVFLWVAVVVLAWVSGRIERTWKGRTTG